MKLLGILVGMLLSGFVQAKTCQLEFDNGAVLEGVELVTTSDAMVTGLSNRESAGQGMLFSWPDADYRVVWMKDTRIPLSVAYIGPDGAVQSILKLDPMSTEYRWSVKPATDVLELARGQFEKHGINTDTVLKRRTCKG